MCELPCSLLSHRQSHEAMRKQDCTANRSFYYFTGFGQRCIDRLQTTQERAKEGRQGKPLNTESELTHGCIPQTLCIISNVKVGCIFQCWIQTHLPSFQGFLSEAVLLPCVKESPKNTPGACNEDIAVFITQKLSKNRPKPVNLRVRSLIQEQHLTEGDKRENERCTLPPFYLIALANHKTSSRNESLA